MSTPTSTKNHLIVGLGGTGGKVLRAFRKCLFQEFGTNTPTIDGLKINYLYVDSSEEMMKFDDASWKILGDSVQLGGESQLLIKGADLTRRLDDIKDFPGIQHWIGNRDQWRDILNNTVGDVLGGQKRRLGRFLFACKATEFRDRVQKLVSGMENSGSKGATFHVCCGLAGGTGSGSVVDAVAQIRDLYRDTKLYRIRIYAYLPETHPRPGYDTGNYHANGYAALMELNALSIGSWMPHDVTGHTNRTDQPTPSDRVRFDQKNFQNPFTGCYLYTNVNDSNIQLDVEEELPAVIADFLYQKIVTSRTVKLDDLDRMENMENRTDTVEVRDRTMEKLRSKSFLAFGIKRIAVPEEEIKEYLTYNFARQAALQLSFNNWSDGRGFTDEPLNCDFSSYVRTEANLARWKMSDDHITLSTPILPNDESGREWKTLPAEWQTLAAGFKDIARQAEGGKSWLDRLEDLYEKRFEENFRKLGVKKFYQVKAASDPKTAMLDEICNTVESELFAELKNGVKSVSEIGKLVGDLVNYTSDRYKDIDKEIQKRMDRQKNEEKAVAANKAEWAKLGILGRALLKKDERLLDAQTLCLERLYIIRTEIEGYTFAKQLLEELVPRLTELKNEVDRCAATVAASLKCFDENAAGRCSEDGVPDMRKNVVRFYEPNKVKSLSQSLIMDADKQRTQTSAARAKLSAELGDRQTFHNFNSRISRDKLIEIFELQCSASVDQVHEAFVLESKGSGRLFGVNIIEKLQERFNPDSEEFSKFVKGLVEQTGVLLPFNDTEINRSGPTIPANNGPSKLFLIVRPKDPARKAFVDALEREFERFSGVKPLYADSVGKTNEISLIRLTNCFPLRFVEPLKFLKEKYDGRSSDRARLEIHLEGNGSQHPSLYVPNIEESERLILPYVLLARPLGLIQRIESRTTGTREFYLMRQDADGLPLDPIPLGKSLVEASEQLDRANKEELEQLVKAALAKPENIHIDKRASLRAGVVEDFNALGESLGNDPNSAVLKKFRAAVQVANQILKGES
jgi:hypothetical protein